MTKQTNPTLTKDVSWDDVTAVDALARMTVEEFTDELNSRGWAALMAVEVSR